MFRLLLTGLACTLLVACASPAPEAPPVQPPVVQAPPPEPIEYPERAFPDESIYPLLLAEFAMRRRAYDVALAQYMDQAPKLRDAGISAHTTHLAQYMGRENEALESVQHWIELEPESPEANNTLSILLIRRGRPDEALPHMAMLARQGREVKFPSLLSGFQRLSPQRQENLATGIESLAQELPNDPRLLLTQAMVMAETDQFDAALASLEQLFLLEPDQSQAAMLEARILLAQGATDPFARLQRILQDNPANKQVRLQYARLLTGTDMVAAREQFEMLSDQAPRDGELLLSLALISRETGDDVAAKSYLRQLLALQQHVDEAHYYLGRIAEDAGDPAAALYEYRQVEDGRELLIAASRGSDILIDQGRMEDNRDWFVQLRDRHPERAEQFYGIEADLLSRSGELEAAEEALDAGLSAMPDSSTLLYARAMLAEQAGDLVQMETDLRAIIDREPDNSTAINALGYTLANRTERYDEAYELIERALALQPDEPAILDSMGWVLYRLNRLDESLQYLTRAYADFPDPEVAAHLGEVLWMLGEQEKALRVWRAALARDPGNGIVMETVERLEVNVGELTPPEGNGAGTESASKDI